MTEPLHPLVTDHAIVRWIERVKGIDVRAEVEAEMLGNGRAGVVQKIQSGRLVLGELGVVLVVDGGKVITVVHKDCRKVKRGKKRRDAV